MTVSPTFFVNGKKVAGAVSYEEMQGVVLSGVPGHAIACRRGAAAKAEGLAPEFLSHALEPLSVICVRSPPCPVPLPEGRGGAPS